MVLWKAWGSWTTSAVCQKRHDLYLDPMGNLSYKVPGAVRVVKCSWVLQPCWLEVGEAKCVLLPTSSLLHVCHVVDRLLSAVADPIGAVTCYERGQPCKYILWLRHLTVKLRWICPCLQKQWRACPLILALLLALSCGFLDGGMHFEEKVLLAKHCPSQSPSCFKSPLV